MPPHGKKFANHWHGSQPVQRRDKAVSKIGKPAVKQHTFGRHYALATIGTQTLVSEVGGQAVFFNGPHHVEHANYAWLEQHRLIERLPAERPGGARRVQRTERGGEVLTIWNERHGLIKMEEW